MSKKIISFLVLAVLFAMPNFAQETFTHEAAKISVTLPAGWMYETSDNGISAYPSEGGFFVYFQVIHADALDAALDEVDKMLNEQMQSVELGQAQDYDVNGMSGIFVEGTADGLLMAVGVMILLLLIPVLWLVHGELPTSSKNITLILCQLSAAFHRLIS